MVSKIIFNIIYYFNCYIFFTFEELAGIGLTNYLQVNVCNKLNYLYLIMQDMQQHLLLLLVLNHMNVCSLLIKRFLLFNIPSCRHIRAQFSQQIHNVVDTQEDQMMVLHSCLDDHPHPFFLTKLKKAILYMY